MADHATERRIYEYLDYRTYLNDYYQSRKQASPAFSLRAFSDRIGFRTKDFILRVMRGEKNLSVRSAAQVAKAMKLSKRESEFFETLVLFNQATDAVEREQQLTRLQTILKAARFAGKQHVLALHQYQVYSHWRHLAIRSLIGLHGFSGDFGALAARVHPGISIEEARQSVELLERCGLIAADRQGSYSLTRSSITTGDRVNKAALQGFHQHCLRLAALSIENDPPGNRNISALTLGISASSYTRIVERLNDFRKEIAQIADEDENADRVYQMQFLLFPLSQ